MIPLLVFVASASLVILSGVTLARRADAIAELTGLGRVWLGSLLLAAATSLPELATGVSAARLGTPDLSAGDLLGSCMFNMVILAMLDLLPPRGQVLQRAALDHALAACLAIGMIGMVGIALWMRLETTILGVSPMAFLLVAVYLAGTRATYRHSVRDLAEPPRLPRLGASRTKLRRELLMFGAGTIGVLLGAPGLAWSAEGIARITGLGSTFVGTLLVAMCTSLPEFVTCMAALRIGALDLAVGNLFGSNAFDMAAFFALDAASPGPAVFAILDPGHGLSALFAIVLTALGLAAIVYRAKRRFAMLEPDSALILVAYALALIVLYGRVPGR